MVLAFSRSWSIFASSLHFTANGGTYASKRQGWLRREKRMRLFRVPDSIPSNNQFTDDFGFMSWEGGGLTYSRASLFYSHKVLKLGAAAITPTQLDGRNLDFVDLDGLVVTQSGWVRSSSIAYASCRNIRLYETDKAFLTFRKCIIENLRVTKCRIQDLHFIDCTLRTPTFEDSRLSRTVFLRTSPGEIRFEDCDLIEFYFIEPPRDMTFAHLSDFYKRLRAAAQQRGNRREASHYFYRERMNEFKSQFFPVVPVEPGFPARGYTGSYVDLYRRWRAGQYGTRVVLGLLGRNALSYVKLIIWLPYLLRLLRRKFKIITEMVDWAVWGFGERPARVFLWMGVVLVAFSAKYYLGTDAALGGKLLESLYCSAFNFATIGCERKTSFDSIEGVLGATLIGIMVAGFANRTRY